MRAGHPFPARHLPRSLCVPLPRRSMADNSLSRREIPCAARPSRERCANVPAGNRGRRRLIPRRRYRWEGLRDKRYRNSHRCGPVLQSTSKRQDPAARARLAHSRPIWAQPRPDHFQWLRRTLSSAMNRVEIPRQTRLCRPDEAHPRWHQQRAANPQPEDSMYASQLKREMGVKGSVFACTEVTSGIIKPMDIARVAKRNKPVGFSSCVIGVRLRRRLYWHPVEQSSIKRREVDRTAGKIMASGEWRVARDSGICTGHVAVFQPLSLTQAERWRQAC